MILTVTLNPAFDHLVNLSELSMGKINRAVSTQRIPGGRGINVASILSVLGEEVVATGFLGGMDSRNFEEPIRKIGVTTNFIYTDQETRTDFYVIEESKKRQTLIIEESEPVKLRFLNSFKSNFEKILSSAELVEIGGSLPKGVPSNFIKELIETANRKNIKVVLNLLESILQECLGKTKLFIVKPDVREDKHYAGEDLKNLNGRIKAARGILEAGAEAALINFGDLKYLAAKKEEMWEGEIKQEDPGILRGVEDGMLAGFMHSYLRKMDVNKALEYGLATALSTAINKTNYPGSREEIENYLTKTTLKKVG